MNDESVFNLISWYQKNKRDLPWRHTKDAYKIWISEVMLQQTRVDTVIDYYNRFIREIKDMKTLANISEEKLLKLWEGLGYYSRARNLQKCAIELVSKNKNNLPKSKEELLSLPGIGPYTAGAILSIAYLQKEPAIDGNVLRVLSRVYKDKRDMLNKNVRKEYEEILKKLMNNYLARDFTESLIELGALICLPNTTPKCLSCPLNQTCLAFLDNEVLNYPVKHPKAKRKIIEKTVFVYTYKNTYQIQKRKEKLLHGLYEFPSIDEFIKDVETYLKKKNIDYQDIKYLGEYKHVFSHLEWHMRAYQIQLTKKNEELYVTKQDLVKKYTFLTSFQEILKNIKE